MSASTKTREFQAARAADLADQAAAHFNDPETSSRLFIPDAPRAQDGLAMGNTIDYQNRSLAEAFPVVEPGLVPFGNLVLVQIRKALEHTGRIILDTETRRTEQYNTQVGKVCSFGPLAFHHRTTGELWPEGAWCSIGDFVRVPKYQGDRFFIQYRRPGSTYSSEHNRLVDTDQIETDEIEFVLFKDLALLGRFTDDPLKVRAFI